MGKKKKKINIPNIKTFNVQTMPQNTMHLLIYFEYDENYEKKKKYKKPVNLFFS